MPPLTWSPHHKKKTSSQISLCPKGISDVDHQESQGTGAVDGAEFMIGNDVAGAEEFASISISGEKIGWSG